MTIFPSRPLYIGILIGLALVVISIYGYFQARNIITGPKIEIHSPDNGDTIASSSPVVTVRGTATNVSFLTLNGRQIFINDEGDFSEKVLLANGYNIIKIEARDKFNHSVNKELQFVVK